MAFDQFILEPGENTIVVCDGHPPGHVTVVALGEKETFQKLHEACGYALNLRTAQAIVVIDPQGEEVFRLPPRLT